MTTIATPASTKIATCYCSKPQPGRGQVGRLVQIRRDNQTQLYYAALIYNHVAEFVTNAEYVTEQAILDWAADQGFDDVVRESR